MHTPMIHVRTSHMPLHRVLILVPPLVYVEPDELKDDSRPKFEIQRLVSPVEPASVAADLRTQGREVRLLDLGAFPDERMTLLEQALEAFQPNAVAIIQSVITFATAKDWDGKAVFDRVRARCPGSLTLLTGAAPTNAPGKAVGEGVCDFELRGEPDLAVGALFRALESGTSLEEIPGLAFRTADGSTFIHPAYPEVELKDLPLPAYDLLDEAHHQRYAEILEKGKIRFPEHSPRYRDIMLSRSCILRCSFCAVAHLRGPKQKYRRKELDRVRAEIEQALEQGIQEIHFFDDLFAREEREIWEFVEMLVQHRLRFPWFVAQGFPLWTLSREVLVALKETGFYRLIAPFESGSQRVLKEVTGKIKSTIDHHHHVAVWARELDLELIGMFVVGMPGESRSEILETVLFAQDHPEIDYTVFSIATPMVGTRLMRAVTAQGLLSDADKINRVIKRTVALYRSDQFREYELGIIRAYDWDRVNFGTPERREKYARMVGISLQELEQLRAHSKQVFHSFYPAYDGPLSFVELYPQPDLFVEAPVIPASLY